MATLSLHAKPSLRCVIEQLVATANIATNMIAKPSTADFMAALPR